MLIVMRWVSGWMIARDRVVHDVRLYSVLNIVIISGEDVCCSVVFGTLVGVFVFSVMDFHFITLSANEE